MNAKNPVRGTHGDDLRVQHVADAYVTSLVESALRGALVMYPTLDEKRQRIMADLLLQRARDRLPK